MTSPLNGVRILVADDQVDVARTICGPLRKAGAKLRFAPDGNAALRDMTSWPFDLVVVDMKMPPDEWGGLWLLRQLNSCGWRVPVLVLSGEGSKQQVIESLRLGATDWIDKDSADTELLVRCEQILDDSLENSLDAASGCLPTPLALRFARYTRTTDPEKQVIEGLHALEAILRFAAQLGLSNPAPSLLSGIAAERLMQPSMGTWFALSVALARSSDPVPAFSDLFSWLAPERGDRQLVQDLVNLRNDIAHGRAMPDPSTHRRVDRLLRIFAHRAFAFWRFSVGVTTSMTFDGAKYGVEVLAFRGVGKPIPDLLQSDSPQVTGQVVLFASGVSPLSLEPWLIAQTTESSTRCFQFDGVRRGRSSLDASTPLKYAKVDDGEDVRDLDHPQGTWAAVMKWL
ncbi:response regulator transcription factor [Streptomyces sp. NPDC091217]|uniref:response regulator transcription factor n=1 Tax=Streptomyces sp. NPDC091217 TaxID=3365975 RepID=UPI00381C1C4A